MNIPRLKASELSTLKKITGQAGKVIEKATPQLPTTPVTDEFLSSQARLLGQNKPTQAPKHQSPPPTAEETAAFVSGLNKAMGK